MSKHVLGIDVSKLEISCTIKSNAKFKHKNFTNNNTGHKALCRWLEEQKLDNISGLFRSY